MSMNIAFFQRPDLIAECLNTSPTLFLIKCEGIDHFRLHEVGHYILPATLLGTGKQLKPEFRIRMFWGLPDPFVTSLDQDPDPSLFS
jgi:hypothetical protein